jgi:mRNA-degrading endonuclease RelE of RelBE toxin-antitoxin system
LKSRRTPRFKKLLAKLPTHVQEQAEKAYQQFKRDPSYNSLDFKQLKSHKSLYSARVGDHYRVLGRMEGDTIIWSWIGTHEDYNKIIGKPL